MKLVRFQSDLRVLGRNEAVRLLVEKHRQIELARRVCEQPQVLQTLERAREFVRDKLAEYGVPLEV